MKPQGPVKSPREKVWNENIGRKPEEHEQLRGRQSKKSLVSKTPGVIGQRFWRTLGSQRKGTFSD